MARLLTKLFHRQHDCLSDSFVMASHDGIRFDSNSINMIEPAKK